MGVACNARGLEAGVAPCGDRLGGRICLSISQRYIHTHLLQISVCESCFIQLDIMDTAQWKKLILCLFLTSFQQYYGEMCS